MSPRIAAACVHILTASGAVLGLLALMAAHAGVWQSMFGWLGVALAVDAVDGPLARYLKVNTVLPRFSGERLDLIIDYLTYVAVPAFVFAQADLPPESFRLPAAAVRDTLLRCVPQALATRALAAQLRFDPEPDVDLVRGR